MPMSYVSMCPLAELRNPIVVVPVGNVGTPSVYAPFDDDVDPDPARTRAAFEPAKAATATPGTTGSPGHARVDPEIVMDCVDGDCDDGVLRQDQSAGPTDCHGPVPLRTLAVVTSVAATVPDVVPVELVALELTGRGGDSADEAPVVGPDEFATAVGEFVM